MFGLGMIVIFVKSEFSKNLSKLSNNFEKNIFEEKRPILMYYFDIILKETTDMNSK